MSNTPPPATTWVGSQEQEYSQTGNPNLDTEAGLDLLSEAGLNLVEENVTTVPLPATVWVQRDDQ